jgi:hypothetical protein
MIDLVILVAGKAIGPIVTPPSRLRAFAVVFQKATARTQRRQAAAPICQILGGLAYARMRNRKPPRLEKPKKSLK